MVVPLPEVIEPPCVTFSSAIRLTLPLVAAMDDALLSIDPFEYTLTAAPAPGVLIEAALSSLTPVFVVVRTFPKILTLSFEVKLPEIEMALSNFETPVPAVIAPVEVLMTPLVLSTEISLPEILPLISILPSVA